GLTHLYGFSDIPAARECFEKILEKSPGDPTALTHLGIAECMSGNFEGALALYEKALSAAPAYLDAQNNKANALKAMGRLDEAIALCEKVRARNPLDPEVHNNIAMALLEAGRFAEGWREYEWRWKTAHLKPAARTCSQPLWQGEEGRGRTLLIYAEQGLGDMLQFCRYVPLAAERGWKVVLEVQPELLSLMKSLDGAHAAFCTGKVMLPFDSQCPAMSLPLALGTEPDTIPAKIPYLAADAEKTRAWAKRISPTPDSLNVGLVWTGNSCLFSADLSAANVRRSLPPDALAPLKDLANVRFFSLQKNGYPLTGGPELTDCMSECADFSDTAALAANMDLIVSVDTSVAHLAGALGKPVWLLNRFDTCWRWMRGRDDSPWYPTMKIFRQPAPGQWAPVIQRVLQELEKRAAAPDQASS
ncbi:MAG: tetratricopeptide repeat-containing glycosyltransferase family protein, partial [Alphaproteobacteria bacterium]|nr:tetratricopeptide repeat-containing glycosyltransferase family protein [Alphaproteobacteria bacterium]